MNKVNMEIYRKALKLLLSEAESEVKSYMYSVSATVFNGDACYRDTLTRLNELVEYVDSIQEEFDLHFPLVQVCSDDIPF